MYTDSATVAASLRLEIKALTLRKLMKKQRSFWMKKNNRIGSIDLIKVIASFSVTAVHFRNRVERQIPEVLIGNKIKLFFSTNYALFILAVPLFLLASGYLSTYSKPSKKRYYNLVKIYGMYIFIALISYHVMIYAGIREPISFLSMIYRAMKFDLISGWYIELYFGLYLLSPYFNIIMDHLTKDETKHFILVLLFTISIPSLINRFPITSTRIWFPNFYVSMYPFVYYVIGSYIRRYVNVENINLKKQILVYLLSLAFIIGTLYRYANPYTKSLEGYYQSIVNVTLATSFFLIIYKKFQNISSKTISFISKYTLSTYIVSLPIDRVFYPRFANLFQGYENLLFVSPLIVLLLYILALVYGWILYNIFELILKSLKNVRYILKSN